ncbi:hypothetical protein Cpir12675_004267 [Ceratocystis pirilliformis]|uniref:Uncharacterized protein n=1 Tax=Ceratocystis pirilliformis TaxID=259994 RepID=A0ABR3YXG6_9PEZI
MSIIAARAPEESSPSSNQDSSGANPAIHGAGGDPKAALGAGPDPVAVSSVEIGIIVATVVVFILGMLLVLWCHQRKKASASRTANTDRCGTVGEQSELGIGGVPLQQQDTKMEIYSLSPIQSKDTGLEIRGDGQQPAVFAIKDTPCVKPRPESSMEEHKDHYDPTKDNN